MAGKYLVFEEKTKLKAPLEEVFGFFSNADNLEKITPEWLHFKILTPLPIQMREGTLIDYRLKLRGIPIRWRSLISEWDPPYSFTDEQIKGPYRAWIHRHSFAREGDTTIMTDTVRYRVLGGALIDKLLVRRDIRKIFKHRTEVIRAFFGS
jgi:ligand-binding SRPBCC domain-containing protein